MRPPIRPKTAPIVPSIRARGIAGIRVIVFSSMVMHLRIQALVTVLCGYKNLVLPKNVNVDVFLGLGRAVHVADAKVNFGIAREGVAEEKRGCALHNHILPV